MDSILYVCKSEITAGNTTIVKGECVSLKGFVLLVGGGTYAMFITRMGYSVQLPIKRFNRYFEIDKGE